MKRKPLVLTAIFGAITVTCSYAQSVALSNLLDPTPGGSNPVTPTSSSVFSGSFPVGNVNNGVSSIFVFGGSDTTPRLNFTGFNSGIDSLEFYDSNFADRVAPSVSVYYSLASTSSLLTSDYTEVGGVFNLTYSGTTTGAANSIGGHQIQYATISDLSIPAGAESLLLTFAAPGGSPTSQNSYGISEIEAFAPQPVPEPSPGIMIFVGSLGLAFRLFWRRCNSNLS